MNTLTKHQPQNASEATRKAKAAYVRRYTACERHERKQARWNFLEAWNAFVEENESGFFSETAEGERLASAYVLASNRLAFVEGIAERNFERGQA